VIPVAAKVFNYKAFSAHGDLNDILNFLKNQDTSKVRIYLVHGEETALNSQKLKLNEAGYVSVNIPGKGKVITFK